MRTPIVLLFLLSGICSLQTQAQQVVFQQELTGEVFPIGHLLRWQTSFEAPGAQFVLEKSSDGLNFQEISQLAGKGGSSIQNDYQFLAPDVVEAVNFYRLRVQVSNHTPVYSSIITMKNKTANQFAILRYSDILPTASFGVEVQGRARGFLQWQIRHLNQSVEDSGQWLMDYGINDYSLDLTSLPEGPYQLSLQFGDEKESLTIRKVSEATLKTMTAGSDALPTNRR